MQVCMSLQTDNHASTPPLTFFTGRMPFLPPNPQRQSTEAQSTVHINRENKYRYASELQVIQSSCDHIKSKLEVDNKPVAECLQLSTTGPHASNDGRTCRKHNAPQKGLRDIITLLTCDPDGTRHSIYYYMDIHM